MVAAMYAFNPVTCFGYQALGRTTATENEGRDWHACWIIHAGSSTGFCVAATVKRCIWMRRFTACFFSDFRRPIFTLPIDRMRWRFFAHTFPPYVTIVSQSDVSEDGIRRQEDMQLSWLRYSCQSHAEVTCFWVDRIQATIFTWFDPSNVVAIVVTFQP